MDNNRKGIEKRTRKYIKKTVITFYKIVVYIKQ